MSVSFDFHGKKALVTGASQGIGHAIAVALAEAGAYVVALARNEARLDELKEKVLLDNLRYCKIHKNISVVVGDVTLPEVSLASLLEAHHPFDFLVNNAGVVVLEHCLNISEDALSKLVPNFHSVRGAVVNVSSQASMRPLTHHTAYCASKAGVDMATRCLAKELGQVFSEVDDVVNAVLFLLSDASAMTTGESFPVDGGFTNM
ncbi:unnamed protein product [Heligmosomoides polygyrus]|uniref:Carbonyl reductase [NADPH] 2 n=1 Tax=Heligmosomoides polygyrus TaxID=6339 RepID=A0A183G8S9_HELPZ|nr:unnamed protein product [Heligmosomoides polygyrus]